MGWFSVRSVAIWYRKPQIHSQCNHIHSKTISQHFLIRYFPNPILIQRIFQKFLTFEEYNYYQFIANIWVISQLIDFVFPIFCLQCSRRGGWLCELCRKSLTPTLPECYICRRLSQSYLTHATCSPSDSLRSMIPHCIPLWRYNSLSRSLMSNFKFKSYFDIEKALELIISSRLPQIHNIEKLLSGSIIVPIPIHRARRQQRGFNQTEIIAEIISKSASELYNLHLPVANLLTKSVNNAHQTGADIAHRKSNVIGAYKINESYVDFLADYNKLLIVDDVITTGATLNEACKVIFERYRKLNLNPPEINAMALFRGRARYGEHKS